MSTILFLGLVVSPELRVEALGAYGCKPYCSAKPWCASLRHSGAGSCELAVLPDGGINSRIATNLRALEKRCMSPISPMIAATRMGPMPGAFCDGNSAMASSMASSMLAIWLYTNSIYSRISCSSRAKASIASPMPNAPRASSLMRSAWSWKGGLCSEAQGIGLTPRDQVQQFRPA